MKGIVGPKEYLIEFLENLHSAQGKQVAHVGDSYLGAGSRIPHESIGQFNLSTIR